MHFDHDDYRCFIATLTTSRRINAAPHNLARILRHPSLFTPSPADRQRPHSITIDLDPVPEGRGAVTLHCPQSGISERHPLRTRHLSTWRLTAETGDDEAVLDVRGTHTFALTVDLSPLLQPGSAIATRVILSFRFVREPWWPHDIAGALGSLANIWLRRLEELATA
ncbi:hypothetical protein [Methylorubrum extorquens]|jgi:hypothetical protein|uniref:Polyketide cyclase n=2 Tax=Methylorubrum extorquens TaxID=408 RepID=B7KRJ0_METC4|nr:hypothetical protein [Methylorubrum extorquens]ACK85517.1 hypothetical protein Mchl_4743 [Methylorubrum extorquens CM4]WHQ69518.1 hypothetical protein KEC54_24795 [Methylorubrum extorquens]